MYELTNDQLPLRRAATCVGVRACLLRPYKHLARFSPGRGSPAQSSLIIFSGTALFQGGGEFVMYSFRTGFLRRIGL